MSAGEVWQNHKRETAINYKLKENYAKKRKGVHHLRIGSECANEIIHGMIPPSPQIDRPTSSLTDAVNAWGFFSLVEVSRCAGEGVRVSFV